MTIDAQSRVGLLIIKDRNAKRIVDKLQHAAFDMINVKKTIQLKKELEEKYPEVMNEIREKDPLFIQGVERIIIRSKRI